MGYGFVRHAKSGDVYAVRTNGQGVILEAAGPVYYGDLPTRGEPDIPAARDLVLAASLLDIKADGAWLEGEPRNLWTPG